MVQQETIVVRANELTKVFAGRKVIDRLSFEVPEGAIFGLLGPNGAGKTTTVNLLLGLLSPNGGAIEILGMPLATQRRQILEKVNFSSAYVTLPGNLSVFENLYVFARLYGVKDPRVRIQEVLELVEFKEDINKLVGVLSAGQKTRLNLCKALLNKPRVLFLDEPTASLDPSIALKVRETLKQIRREEKTTVIYTSHNMQEVENLCDEVIFLSRGKIVAQGAPQSIVAQKQSRSLEEVFIAIARDGELKDLKQAEVEE